MHRYEVGDKVSVIDADVEDADYCLKFFANESYDGKVFEIVELSGDYVEDYEVDHVRLLIPIEVRGNRHEDDDEFTWWFHVDALRPYYGDFFDKMRPPAPKKAERQI